MEEYATNNTEIENHEASIQNYEFKVQGLLNAHDDLYEKHVDL